MGPNVKPMRYAHSDGHTDLCFDDSGRYLLTCGFDGDARIWDGFEDDDAISHRVGDKVYAIAFKNGRFFTASDLNSVQAYIFPDGSPDGILTRFTAPVTHMCLNKSGTTLLAGASDFNIKVVEVETCSCKTLQGHEAPVLGVALDPKEEFLASSSCDGTVRVWNVQEQKSIQDWKLLPKCNDVSLSKTLCRLCWEPDNGKHLVVPVEKDIHVYERDSWKKVFTLTDNTITEFVSIVTFSPCAKYLAASCVDGTICVWDWKTRKCVSRTKHSKKLMITALVWNPKGNNELAFCDNQGQLGLIENVISASSKEDALTSEGLDATEGVFDDDNDFLIQATGDDGLPGGDDPGSDDDDDPFNLPMKKPGPLDDLQSNGDEKSVMSDLDDVNSLMDVATKQPVYQGPKPTLLQKAFQPGSTPDHLSSRFMKWNSVGIVRQYNSDEENSIDIEFHDTAVHHTMHLNNDSGYTVADISTEAIVLAAEAEDGLPSKLFCMHFGSWDNSKEWSVSMPEGENIEAVCVGEGWVGVATDARMVRMYTVAGVQREVFTLPGPVVSMAGHINQILVIFHRGTGIPGDQCLGATLLQMGVRNRSLLSGEPIPLSGKATLHWIGFTAEGTPVSVDSTGVVRMLNRGFGNTWLQVCNTNQHARGKSDHYWIVGVNENPQQLRCIMCKGSKFPPTLPRPMVSILPFQIPMCELTTEKSQYEETLWRTRLFTGHIDVLTSQGYEVDSAVKTDLLKPAQEALMKLFALSARSDRECRAVEVCEMMPDEHTLQLAIKYASRLRRIQLAERISDVARSKAEQDIEEEMVEEYTSYDHSKSRAAASNDWSHRNGHGAPRRAWRGMIGEQDDEAREEGGEEDDMEEDGQEEEEEEEERASGPRLNLKPKEVKSSQPTTAASMLRKNPFKVATPLKGPAPAKGSKVFDEIPKNNKPLKSPTMPFSFGGNKAADKKKGSSQMKLFKAKEGKDTENKKLSENARSQTAVKKKSAYDLWLEENQSDLQEEHPDLSEEELNTQALDSFRMLPKEERQVWLQKARAGATDENSVTNDTDKKRKRDEAEESPSQTESELTQKKAKKVDGNENKLAKPLSQTTNSKLSSFAFAKTD